MSEFLYIYRRPPMPPLSPQQMQDRMQRWQAWFKKLDAAIVNLGQPLDNERGAVVRDGKGRVSDGPYAETKDIVIGYTLVHAKDLNHAIELTADWPGFDEDGLIEVRPILKM